MKAKGWMILPKLIVVAIMLSSMPFAAAVSSMPLAAEGVFDEDDFVGGCGGETEVECEYEDDELQMPRTLLEEGTTIHWSYLGKSSGTAHTGLGGDTWGCYDKAEPSSSIAHVNPSPTGPDTYAGHKMPSSTTNCTTHNAS